MHPAIRAVEGQAVQLDKVTKRYGSVTAVDDVSLTVAAEEFFALLGPSGSGKSTLLRLIAGFIAPDSGRIFVGDERIDLLPAHRRNIAMVFQQYALFPHMTVAENVAFGLDVRRVARREKVERVQAMLHLVHLEGLENRRPSQLSGGQQQRVALARALITEPRVLLLDEPLAALDKKLRAEMQGELKQLQREVGITTIFVTHDQEEALTLADRIAIIRDGRIVQVGPSREVYERPKTAFVASFLGSANMFRGTVTAPDAGASLGDAAHVDCGHGIRLRTLDPLPAPGRPVTLAVRPEKIRIAASEESAGTIAADQSAERNVNRLSGTVRNTVFAGASQAYDVDVAGHTVTVFEQNVVRQTMARGDTVDLVWSPADTFVIEEEDG